MAGEMADNLVTCRNRQPGLAVSVSRRDVLTLGALLLAVELLLRYLYTAPILWWSVRPWFDLDGEANIPSWFSSMQLLAVGLLAAYCAWRESTPHGARWRNGWWLIMAIFLYLSIDEAAKLHETVGHLVSQRVRLTWFEGGIWSVRYWILAFLPVLAWATGYLIQFFWRRFAGRPYLLLTVTVGLISWLGVLVCEFVPGVVSMSQWHAIYLIGWEELLEMVGATCFLVAVLRYATTLPSGSRLP